MFYICIKVVWLFPEKENNNPLICASGHDNWTPLTFIHLSIYMSICLFILLSIYLSIPALVRMILVEVFLVKIKLEKKKLVLVRFACHDCSRRTSYIWAKRSTLNREYIRESLNPAHKLATPLMGGYTPIHLCYTLWHALEVRFVEQGGEPICLSIYLSICLSIYLLGKVMQREGAYTNYIYIYIYIF